MKNKIIYTNVEWFSATDEPEKNAIPNKILDAENIWNANGGKSTPEICALVSNFIKCNGVVRQSLTRIKVLWSHNPMMHKFGTTP